MNARPRSPVTGEIGRGSAFPGGRGTFEIDALRYDAVVFAEGALVVTAGTTNRPAGISLTAASGALDLLRSLRGAGIRSAAISPGRDLPPRLAVCGLDELVEIQVDEPEPAVGTRRDLPSSDLAAEALRRLSVPGARAVLVVPDGEGPAGRGGAGFGLVVRVGHDTAPVARPAPAVGVEIPSLCDLAVAPPPPGELPDTGRPSRWHLHFAGTDPADEPRREVLCATGNGYVVSRGAAPESSAGGPHYPGTYLAGVYNRLVTVVDGRTLEHEELVNVPNWLPLTFRPVGERSWFGEAGWVLLEHHQSMQLRYGILHRRMRVRDPAGRVTCVVQRQLASMDDPHLLALETVLMAENWSGDVEVRSGVDGGVTNAGVGSYRLLARRHLAPPAIVAVDDETVALTAATVQSGVRIAVATRTRCETPGALTSARSAPAKTRVDVHLTVRLRRDRPAAIEKVGSFFTSRDHAISDCTLAALTAVARAGRFDALAAAHRAEWERLWARSGLWVDVDGRLPMIVNLHLLHLLQSVSPHTAELDAGIPARGLHGEAYRGHVFWDELFLFPLLNFRLPKLARALLRYRHRRLPEARRLARLAGYRGAMFPWQSGMTGREETPTQYYNPRSRRWVPDRSRLQRHVGLAVAYNVWAHYQVTGDVEPLLDFGAELMIEIARFWVSAATYDPSRGRFDIRGVMGPDEFHDGPPDAPGSGLTNNAYTNVMAAWVLWRARQMVRLLAGHGGSRLFERLDLRPDELDDWERVGTRLAVPFDRKGRILQFDGYELLEELDWDAYRARYGDIGRLDLILEAEGDTPNRYKVAKQADVLMLFFMLSAEELTAVLDRLGYRFDPATIPDTIDYYLARTSNGSTLSSVVHAWVLARSDRPASWQLLADALAADIDDVQGGTTGEGIHLGAMAGTVDLLQRCFVDLVARDDVLYVNPRLPDQLPRLRFAIDYRGHRIELDMTHHAVTIRSRPSVAAPVRVAVRRDVFELGGGARVMVPLSRP